MVIAYLDRTNFNGFKGEGAGAYSRLDRPIRIDTAGGRTIRIVWIVNTLFGDFDDALPGGKFLLVSPPPHPFRFGRRIGQCPQAFSAELPVQRRGSALNTTETVLSLAAVSKVVSLLPMPVRGSTAMRYGAAAGGVARIEVAGQSAS